MPKQKRSEVTRRAILDAAATVFDEQGFTSASLTDIVARAGVTKGALYFHFPSKEDLANALIDEQFATSGNAGNGELGLQTAIDLSHEVAHNLQFNIRVRASIWLAIDQGAFHEPIRAPWLRWNEIVLAQLEESGRRGDLRTDIDPVDAANYIVASFAGVQISSHVLTGRADIRTRVTNMWKLILPGIVAPDRLSTFDPSGR